MNTTLNKIKQRALGSDNWKKFLAPLNKTEADDEPLSLLTILESNGLDDAIWCLRTVEGHDKEIRLFAVDIAERYANTASVDASVDAWPDAWAAARAVADTARAVAVDVAREKEKNWQTQRFIEMVKENK